MWQTLALPFSLLIVGLANKPASGPAESQSCKDILKRHGVSEDNFALSATHGSHSLYLDDIRHFFDADAPEQTRIPVLNFNIGSQDTIWPNYSLVGFDQGLLR